MKPFKYLRQTFGAHVVYLVEGASPEWGQVVVCTAPHQRKDHRRVVAVISGSGTVTGPRGISWKLEPGMVDEDMPGYPAAGDYAYAAGPSGISFFCAARADQARPRRIPVDTAAELVVPEGNVFLCIAGTAIVGERDALAPFIVDATEQAKTVRPVGDIKGVLLCS
jgi:hypothetical protein